jgi:hypothetical protein
MLGSLFFGHLRHWRALGGCDQQCVVLFTGVAMRTFGDAGGFAQSTGSSGNRSEALHDLLIGQSLPYQPNDELERVGRLWTTANPAHVVMVPWDPRNKRRTDNWKGSKVERVHSPMSQKLV